MIRMNSVILGHQVLEKVERGGGRGNLERRQKKGGRGALVGWKDFKNPLLSCLPDGDGCQHNLYASMKAGRKEGGREGEDWG